MAGKKLALSYHQGIKDRPFSGNFRAGTREVALEFLGDIERFFAELYPYRWPILALVFLALAAVAGAGVWHHRVGLAVIGTPSLAAAIAIGIWLGSLLFHNVTVVEDFPFAAQAAVPSGMTKTEVEQVMPGMAQVS
jgi:hypothetical protein